MGSTPTTFFAVLIVEPPWNPSIPVGPDLTAAPVPGSILMPPPASTPPLSGPTGVPAAFAKLPIPYVVRPLVNARFKSNLPSPPAKPPAIPPNNAWFPKANP